MIEIAFLDRTIRERRRDNGANFSEGGQAISRSQAVLARRWVRAPMSVTSLMLWRHQSGGNDAIRSSSIRIRAASGFHPRLLGPARPFVPRIRTPGLFGNVQQWRRSFDRAADENRRTSPGEDVALHSNGRTSLTMGGSREGSSGPIPTQRNDNTLRGKCWPTSRCRAGNAAMRRRR